MKGNRKFKYLTKRNVEKLEHFTKRNDEEFGYFVKRNDMEFEYFINELVTAKKSRWDSWPPGRKTIQWFKIKKYLGNDFDKFIELINKSINYDVLKSPFEDLRMSYEKHGEKLDIVIDFLIKKKKMPIVNFLRKKAFNRSEILQCGRLSETIDHGVDKACFLDGVILVPYNKDFEKRLIKNTTNILDGGYVEIEGKFYEDELVDLENFQLVGDISDEKY